jgi:hypothetical protein
MGSIQKSASSHLWLIATTLGLALLSGPAKSDQPGYEPYSARGDILQVEPVAHRELGTDWERLRRGHLEAVAQVLGVYPDHHIYFLARDAELLYDLARVATRHDPKHQARIHLLNVSRTNMNSVHLKDYLTQEGISEDSLRAGKKVMFVDTGFSGTIPRVISNAFPPELRGQLKTHLMSSSNADHPSSRVFLNAINPAAALIPPSSMHGTIISYEHLSRFTDRSTQFEKVADRWEAMSPLGIGGPRDGSTSKKHSHTYREDLKAYFLEPQNEKLFGEREKQWNKLRALSELNNAKRGKIVAELKAILKSGDPSAEAIVRDYVELQTTNLEPEAVEVHLSELGLHEIFVEKKNQSNKNKLIKKYPEWAPILEDPEVQIGKLIENGEWGKLGAIVDAIYDQEFTLLLAKELGKQPVTPVVKKFIEVLIEKGGANTHETLAAEVFSKAHGKEMPDLLRMLIEKGNAATHRLIVDQVILKHGVDQMDNFARMIIEKDDAQAIGAIIKAISANPERPGAANLLSLAIAHADHTSLWQLPNELFSKPESSKMREQLALLIEKGDSHTLGAIERYAFTQSHWNTPENAVLRQSLSISDPADRLAFLKRDPQIARAMKAGAEHAPSVEPLPTADHKPGKIFKTHEGRTIRIEAFVDVGKRGRVYRVIEPSTGKTYALKVARDSKPETLHSISEESSKAHLYQKLQLPHSAVIEAQPTYVLKEWIDGQRADQWMQEWEKKGSPQDDPALADLKNLLAKSAQKGAYIGDLNAKNLIRTGKSWVIIDSGGIREGLSVQEAAQNFLDKFPKRWAKKAAHPESAASCLLNVLQGIATHPVE